jgi:hypothetical protein
MELVNHIIALAPEGEVVLFTKQVEREGGYAYPAFRKPRGEGAWYVNIGSFIESRFDGQRVSAGAAFCENVWCLVLDDVGTKSKTPTIRPTWIIETSKDNFQWCYVFRLDDQPHKSVYSAAIKAIAAAGYTDPGAINPVRNIRIPGSINLKPGKDRFAARLVEFNPSREFSLEEICGALSVVPGAVETTTFRPGNLKDDGSDDVLAWLVERKEVTQGGNSAGWWGVICPNSAEHSDGNPEGRYMPASRAYCCLHSHCIEWDSARFLAWVEEQGGPKRTYGLRDELLASVMGGALSKLTPTAMFTDDAKAVIAQVEARELGRVERSGWHERFAYIQTDDAYFDLVERREITRRAFDSTYRGVMCTSMHQTGKSARLISASLWFDENRQACGGRILNGITYAAGDSVLVSRNGEVFGNWWRDARPSVSGAISDISIWLDHCARLVPERSELEHIWDAMAYKVQHPEVKINHAILHGGDEGCGKDTMWAPFIWAVCGEGKINLGIVDNDSISSQWGYQLESEILLINELKEPNAADRRQLANKLKPIIAAPPDVLPINRKGLHPYMMANRGFVLAFTNDLVPISLGSQDRRWFCIWSHAPRMHESAGRAMWDWFNAGGFDSVASWLYARDVSKFNPAATPAMTEFKANLVENSMSSAESWLLETIRARRSVFARGVIGSPFQSVCDTLGALAPAGVKLYQSALLHALKEAGWVDCGRLSARALPTRKHIFCAPDNAGMSASDLRRAVEPEPIMGNVTPISAAR